MKKFMLVLTLVLALCLLGSSALAEDTAIGTIEREPDHWHGGIPYGNATVLHDDGIITTPYEQLTFVDLADIETTPTSADGPYVLITKPTCTTYGIVRYLCTYEGHIVTHDGTKPEHTIHWHEKMLAPLGHDWSHIHDTTHWGRVIKEPTCTSTGEAEDYCLRCGVVNTDIKPRVIDMVPHKFKDQITPADCTHLGVSLPVCTVCGFRVEEAAILLWPDLTDSKVHDWDVWVTERAATCDKEGIEVRWCKRCGEKQQRILNKLAPKWVLKKTTLTDCYTERYDYVCANCDGKVAGHTKTEWNFDVTAHVFHSKSNAGEIIAEVKPTCTDAGYKVYKCIICEDQGKSIAVPAQPDNPKGNRVHFEERAIVNGKPVRLAEYKLGDFTDDEGYLIDGYEYVEVPALGHKWTDWIERYAAGEKGNEYGYWFRVCERCELTEETISKLHPSNYPDPDPATHIGENGLAIDWTDGLWKLFKDGKVDYDFTGIATYNGGKFFIDKGVLCWWADGLNLYNGTWYFLSQGQVQEQFNSAKDGFAFYNQEFFYLVNGVLDTKVNGLRTHDGAKFVIAAGRLVKEVNGLWLNPEDNTWYFVAAGKVAEGTSGVVSYDGSFFVIKDGKLDTSYTGTIEYDGATFNVIEGQLKDKVQ